MLASLEPLLLYTEFAAKASLAPAGWQTPVQWLRWQTPVWWPASPPCAC